MDEINNIKELWSKIDGKKDFVLECAKYFDMKATSLYNHWFSGFWSIPKNKQEKLITFMEGYINKHN